MADDGRLLTQRGRSRDLPLAYRAFIPDRTPVLPPLVIVHGSARTAGRYFRAFLPSAIRLELPLIAPTFSKDRFGGYQQLGGLDGPLSATRATLAVLEDARLCLGLDTTEVDLFGFSGGAQFAHRHVLLAPGRVRRLVVASSGWYTFLNSSRPFPHGTGASQQSSGETGDIDAFLRLPVHVLVGERDVHRDPSLRRGPNIDRRQGPDRLTRALHWIDHVEDVARARELDSRISFDLLPRSGHSFSDSVRRGRLVERTLSFLHPPVPEATSMDWTQQ